MYSGGANGSDTMWELISQTYGLTNVFHFYYGNKTPRENKEGLKAIIDCYDKTTKQKTLF